MPVTKISIIMYWYASHKKNKARLPLLSLVNECRVKGLQGIKCCDLTDLTSSMDIYFVIIRVSEELSQKVVYLNKFV